MEVLLYPKCKGIDLHHAMYIMLNCFLSTFYCLILHRVTMFFLASFF